MRIGNLSPTPCYQPSVNQPTTNRAASGNRSASLELTVTTAEGDKVTLSAQALQAFSLQSGDGRASASTTRQLSIAVNVEGDLNREELADIRKLAIAIGKSARLAERGNVSQATRTIAQASRKDTIATFQFHYERRAELQYGEVTYQQISSLT